MEPERGGEVGVADESDIESNELSFEPAPPGCTSVSDTFGFRLLFSCFSVAAMAPLPPPPELGARPLPDDGFAPRFGVDVGEVSIVKRPDGAVVPRLETPVPLLWRSLDFSPFSLAGCRVAPVLIRDFS